MRAYRELKVWEKSHLLALNVYKATKCFPKEETYGLTSQIRRACSSIAINIAEGCGRDSSREFAQFLNIALGSSSEVSYELLLAHDLGFLDDQAYLNLVEATDEVMKMLAAYIRKIKAEHEHQK